MLSVKFSTNFDKISAVSVMKLYVVAGGPPSLAVRLTLKALNIPFELIDVNYNTGEHLTENYYKLNPQREIPVLDDDGFYLQESVAIMQYLCDKYAPDNSLYPKDPKQRALVNQRLCFNMGFYYSSIAEYVMAPIFYNCPRTPLVLKKLNNSLKVFEEYLRRAGTKYTTENHITIADCALFASTLSLDAVGFNLDQYPRIKKWYEIFKKDNPNLWTVVEDDAKIIAELDKNPPDLSKLIEIRAKFDSGEN